MFFIQKNKWNWGVQSNLENFAFWVVPISKFALAMIMINQFQILRLRLCIDFTQKFELWFQNFSISLLTLMRATSGRPCQVRRGAPGAPPIYLSHLWSDFQNSCVWWKLVKIVIDIYSITDFLSFIVWPPEVVKVAKVNHVNIFK